MIVTIDGRAGSGKSLAARRLAQTLEFRLLATGAMYRAAAIALADAGVDIFAEPRDVATISRLVNSYHFEMPGTDVWLNGADFTWRVDSEHAGAAASRVGMFPEVRERLKAEQRRIAAHEPTICEGRDQGTSVFPDAPVKFFVTASVDVRAQRRAEQEAKAGRPADLRVLREQIRFRDMQDESRPIDPLRQAADAIAIDTTTLTPDDVLAIMVAEVQRCRSRG
jgi:CMP/dCMP kinase